MEIIHLVLVSVYFIFYLLAKTTGFWQRYETEEVKFQEQLHYIKQLYC